MKQVHWGSKLGFILATAGSAIGLGNIWRFPYLAGSYGGGSFLLLYILCIIGLGYFLLLGKLAFGRVAQTNIVDGFCVVANKNKKQISPLWGYLIGGLSILNALLVTGVYVVVIGWTLSYFVLSAVHLFGPPIQINTDMFHALTSSFGSQMIWGSLCILITSAVLIKGVKKGIERISLLLMPFLFILLIFMVVWMFFLPNSGKGLSFLFMPDWQTLGFTENGFDFYKFSDVLLAAVGQALYSLSMGLGVIFVYGSYLSDKTNLKNATKWIVTLDTLVAVMAGMIVLPAVFSFNMQPDSGPSLSFISLPMVFSQMTGGAVFMFMFFALLFIAALTSLISIYEGIVNLIIGKRHLSRTQATGLLAIVNACITAIILASFTDKISWRMMGQDLFSAIDTLTGSYLMSLMMVFVSFFMGWFVSSVLIRDIANGTDGLSKSFKRYMRFTLRFTAPIVLLVLLGLSLFE